MLPVVHVPASERLRVLSLVLPRARVSGAGQSTSTAVQAKLQAERVDMVCDCFHTLRKLLRVGDEVPGGVARLSGPAIIDVDVGIAHVFQTKGEE